MAPHQEHGHTISDIQQRLSDSPRPSYLKDYVLGGIDGAVTTFAIVAGVVGAEMSARVILILGIANLIADGFSMAAGNYSGTKAEADDYHRLLEIENRHIDENPAGEREEIRQIFMNKGLSDDTLEAATDAIISDRSRWLEMMLTEEYGRARSQISPWSSAGATFIAFFLCGAVPLLPFLFDWPNPFMLSLTTTGIVFLGIGALKSRWSLSPAWKSSLETLAIGGLAAGAAYVIGDALAKLL
jgi:VIT1/CCC1 family predicted Fe2+/Mn2+ transporter